LEGSGRQLVGGTVPLKKRAVLDAGHNVPAYWYGKHQAASLFGTGPAYGFSASQYMGWFFYGGGQALYDELVQKILNLNATGFFVFAFAYRLARYALRFCDPEQPDLFEARSIAYCAHDLI
jgi:hypothetical protein